MSAVQLTKLNSKLIFNTDALKELLPDIESALFFAQLYRLNAQSLGVLIGDLFNTPLATALTKEGGLHSNLLQDYLIDIGPEGGEGGGTVIAKGTPEEVAATPGSYTGKYVKKYLNV